MPSSEDVADEYALLERKGPVIAREVTFRDEGFRSWWVACRGIETSTWVTFRMKRLSVLTEQRQDIVKFVVEMERRTEKSQLHQLSREACFSVRLSLSYRRKRDLCNF